MRVHLLGSGSDGNSTLIISGDTAILIDAGLGSRQLKQRLNSVGLSLRDITACLITHEHIDHVRGLQTKNFPDVPIFTAPPTCQAIAWQYRDTQRFTWVAQPVGVACQIGDFTIENFATSHDAISSVGYIIHAEHSTLLYATDLGVSDDDLSQAITLADYVIVESNHDVEMLRSGPYPWHLKQRVASSKGHLSNYQTANLLASSLNGRTRWVALAHLSRTNNLPPLALQTVSESLTNLQDLHPRLSLHAAPALASGQMLTLEG